MNNLVYRFIKYGCGKPTPKKSRIDINLINDYNEVKDSLSSSLKCELLKLPQDSIFELSGGIDSSFIVSHFKGIKTFCASTSESNDKKYSSLISNEFNTRHESKDQNVLLSMINFKKAIVDICKNSKYPYAFKNDLGMYAFLNYISNKTNHVVCGSGIEFQLMGYYTLFNSILEQAIGIKEYDVKRALSYLEFNVKREKDVVPLDYKECLKYKKGNKYRLSQPKWWNSPFTDEEIFKLMNVHKSEITFTSIFEIENFILEWFGKLYTIDRPADIAKIFGVTFFTPYMEKSIIDMTRKIPVELKKALNYHKYIFYQIASEKLPWYILSRKKGGLDLDVNYFRKKENDILELSNRYLGSRSLKIYNYLDFKIVKKIHKEFRVNFDGIFKKLWLLLNLSIWLEENGNICD